MEKVFHTRPPRASHRYRIDEKLTLSSQRIHHFAASDEVEREVRPGRLTEINKQLHLSVNPNGIFQPLFPGTASRHSRYGSGTLPLDLNACGSSARGPAFPRSLLRGGASIRLTSHSCPLIPGSSPRLISPTTNCTTGIISVGSKRIGRLFVTSGRRPVGRSVSARVETRILDEPKEAADPNQQCSPLRHR